MTSKKNAKGLYRKRVTLGYNEQGKPIIKSFTSKTKAGLESKVKEFMDDYTNPQETFLEFAEKWYSSKKLTIGIESMISYERVIYNYSRPLKDMYICDIKKGDLQEIINANADHPATCKKIATVYKQIFNYAFLEGNIERDISAQLFLPKLTHKKKRPLTESEKYLLTVTEFDDMELAYLLLIQYNGLRRGEALALRVGDFDFLSGTISINKSYSLNIRETLLKTPKTASGVRIVPIIAKEREFLSYYVSTCDDWLFPEMEHNSFEKFWKKIIAKLNAKADELGYPRCEGLTSHIFRHNYATMLFHSGVNPKEAQSILGHSSFAITMDVYTHLEDSSKKVGNSLDRYIGY